MSCSTSSTAKEAAVAGTVQQEEAQHNVKNTVRVGYGIVTAHTATRAHTHIHTLHGGSALGFACSLPKMRREVKPKKRSQMKVDAFLHVHLLVCLFVAVYCVMLLCSLAADFTLART